MILKGLLWLIWRVLRHSEALFIPPLIQGDLTTMCALSRTVGYMHAVWQHAVWQHATRRKKDSEVCSGMCWKTRRRVSHRKKGKVLSLRDTQIHTQIQTHKDTHTPMQTNKHTHRYIHTHSHTHTDSTCVGPTLS